MATTFKTPGVYIQEIASLPASVAQVETAIPAFIGYTTKTVTEPKRISSMVEFVDIFGGAQESMITVDIIDDPNNLGTDIVAELAPETTNAKKTLFYNMQMYFANGGGPCWVVSIPAITKVKINEALTAIKKEDEPTLIVIPEAVQLSTGDFETVMKNALEQCNSLQDRFTIMDVNYDSSTFTTDADNFRNGIGTQYLKYGAAYYPRLNTSLLYDDASVKVTYSSPNDIAIRDAFIGSGVETLEQIIALAEDVDHPDYLIQGKFLSQFLSEQLGAIRNKIAEQNIVLGPCSTMAGVYANVDRNLGVWKAPANISLNMVKEPSQRLNNTDQGYFNVHPTGKSINVIRSFTGKGNIVWGARTLAGNDNEWRYVPVRRLFITAEESIKKATEFVVFEPNDKSTWQRTRVMIENYLTLLWRQGALAGAKPEDAFFVNVGLGQTMTSQDILEGRLIIEVGMAAVRPAEFIILNFSHKLQES